LRFVLAYLWSTSNASKEPYDEFWRYVGKGDMWSFQGADSALKEIYKGLSMTRDKIVPWRMWERAQKSHSDYDPDGRPRNRLK